MNKTSIILASLALLALTFYVATDHKKSTDLLFDLDDQFDEFLFAYQPSYASAKELEYRKTVFAANLKLIKLHNSDNSQSFTVKVNEFADKTFAELKSFYATSFNQPNSKQADKCPESSRILEVADSINWTEKGKVSPVKDQKNCGSCWAFSAVGALESAISIRDNATPVELSEQELVSCSKPYGNKGCKGGFMHFAYNYILEHKINLEEKYPYKAWTLHCKTSKIGEGPIEMKGCARQRPEVDGLIEALNVGPVAVGFFADILMFFYDEGIFSIESKLCDFDVDHGVVAVGYVKDHETPYFIVKNSWGSSWGENGYFRIAMGTGTGLCRLSGSGYNYFPIV